MKTLKRVAFGGLIIMMGMLATATIVEKIHGTASARAWFYDNIAFVVLWAIITVAAVGYIASRKMWKRPSLLLLHAALVVILCGAGITWFTAQHGKMQAADGQAINVFTSTDGVQHTLPF